MTSTRDAMMAALEKQGAHIRKTKKGLWIQTPKGTTTVHFTNSDHRAQDNEIASFRRIGLVHPEDSRAKVDLPSKVADDGYPSYLHTQVKPATRMRILSHLEELGWPLRVTVYDLRDFGSNTSVVKALFAVGYRYPLGPRPKGGYVWEAPNDIKELHEKAREQRQSERAGDETIKVTVTETVNGWDDKVTRTPELDPKPEVQEDHPSLVDFIDERDSWVIDLKELLGPSYRFIEEKLAVLGVVGIEHEFRVWRKTDA